MFVALSRLTRRQALKLGAAAAALGSLKPGSSALAAPRAEAFTLALPEHGATAAGGGWRTTRIYDAPRRFDLIGLGWRRPAHVHAQVRARRHGGRWSRWAPLHATGDHGPDAAAPRAGTDPVWTGDADQFQLRLRGGASGLHARFVRSGPAARAARRRVRAGAARQIPGAPAIRYSNSQRLDACTNSVDLTDNLVARYDWQCRTGQFAIDNMQIGTADAAGRHAYPNLTWSGHRIGQLREDQGLAWLSQLHRIHRIVSGRCEQSSIAEPAPIGGAQQHHQRERNQRQDQARCARSRVPRRYRCHKPPCSAAHSRPE